MTLNPFVKIAESEQHVAALSAEKKRHEALYWPNSGDAGDRSLHLYEIRNGHSLEYVEAHVRALVEIELVAVSARLAQVTRLIERWREQEILSQHRELKGQCQAEHYAYRRCIDDVTKA